jgi:GT2 family glycosyltransferase
LVREIIVVNNSGADQSLGELSAGSISLRIVTNLENAGFARACNQGAGIATGAYLLFLNPDCQVDRLTLLGARQFLNLNVNSSYAACGVQLKDKNGEIARCCAKLPSAFSFMLNAVGFQYLFPRLSDGFHMHEWAHDHDRDVEHIIGAFYFIRTKVFIELGKFDDRFLVYLEDLDLSSRLIGAGLKIRYLAGVSAFHLGGGASSKVLAARLYYSLSSRLRYCKKHHSNLGFISVTILTLCVEPLIRLGDCCRGSPNSLKVSDIIKAYIWLWTDFIANGAGKNAARAR